MGRRKLKISKQQMKKFNEIMSRDEVRKDMLSCISLVMEKVRAFNLEVESFKSTVNKDGDEEKKDITLNILDFTNYLSEVMISVDIETAIKAIIIKHKISGFGNDKWIKNTITNNISELSRLVFVGMARKNSLKNLQEVADETGEELVSLTTVDEQ